MNIVLVLVVLYNVLVIGGIGLYLSQREKASGQVTDMATGGRNANLAMFSVTMAITYLGSAHRKKTSSSITSSTMRTKG